MAGDILSELARTPEAHKDVLIANCLAMYRHNMAPAGEVLLKMIQALAQRNAKLIDTLVTLEDHRPRVIQLGCMNPQCQTLKRTEFTAGFMPPLAANDIVDRMNEQHVEPDVLVLDEPVITEKPHGRT